MDNTVCVIIVTFNRKELLLESLNAILAQTKLPNALVIVDNASTDGTEKLLHANDFIAKTPPKSITSNWSHTYHKNDVKIFYLKMVNNEGGAGGFHEGMKYALEKKYDWLWVMDDDSIPEKNALETLFQQHCKLKEKGREAVLYANRVDWIDNTVHPMNTPMIKRGDFDQIYQSLEDGILPIRSSSFVGMFILAKMVEEYGLPYKKYFIWNDDFEYTARVLKKEKGYVVPTSIIVHKTKEKYTPISSAGDRFYYEVRNKIWMTFKSDAWEGKEKLYIIAISLFGFWSYFRQSPSKIKALKIIIKGLASGIFTSPK